VAMTAMSATSLKTHCPNLPVHIFTDCDISAYDCFDSSTKIKDPHRRFGAKVDHIFKTPYQKTLFLDADTRICEDIAPMFDLLDRYDIAMAYDNGRAKRPKRYVGPAPKIFLPLNSGVILYKRTEPVIGFFKTWQEALHKDGGPRDQITLRELLWMSDLRLWVLPPEYNCRPKGYIKVLLNAGITPKILHLMNFKKEAGIGPRNPVPLRRKFKRFIKNRIKKPIRRLILGLPY